MADNKFRDMRNAAKLTAEQACVALDVSISTLMNWEQGKTSPDADKLVEMTKAYGCTADELLALA